MTQKQLKLFKEKYEHKFDEALSGQDRKKAKKIWDDFFDEILKTDFIEHHGHHGHREK